MQALIYIYITTTVVTNIYPHTFTAHFLYYGSLSLTQSVIIISLQSFVHTAHQDFRKLCVCVTVELVKMRKTNTNKHIHKVQQRVEKKRVRERVMIFLK
jgi:hypothetical protein